MKQLILCRHAKSSWKNITIDDIDRRLNKRGKQDAPMMGKRLALKGIRPDAMISSPATRARKTAVRLAKELNFSKDSIKIEKVLYGAHVDEMFNLVNGLDDSWGQVIIIGHNPEMTMFAHALADFNVFNIPTCGIVCVKFQADHWKEIMNKSGEVVFFDYPKKVVSEVDSE